MLFFLINFFTKFSLLEIFIPFPIINNGLCDFFNKLRILLIFLFKFSTLIILLFFFILYFFWSFGFISILCKSSGKSINTGPILPLYAILIAFSNSYLILLGSLIKTAYFVIGFTKSATSISWNPICLMFLFFLICLTTGAPEINKEGIESKKEHAIPCNKFMIPGPLVPIATPSFPETL